MIFAVARNLDPVSHQLRIARLHRHGARVQFGFSRRIFDRPDCGEFWWLIL